MRKIRRLCDEDAALTQVLGLPFVGFLECQHTVCPTAAIEQLLVSRHLQLDAGRAIIPELAREQTTVLLNGPEAFADPRTSCTVTKGSTCSEEFDR
jgi:hypothetical protein